MKPATTTKIIKEQQIIMQVIWMGLLFLMCWTLRSKGSNMKFSSNHLLQPIWRIPPKVRVLARKSNQSPESGGACRSVPCRREVRRRHRWSCRAAAWRDNPSLQDRREQFLEPGGSCLFLSLSLNLLILCFRPTIWENSRDSIKGINKKMLKLGIFLFTVYKFKSPYI